MGIKMPTEIYNLSAGQYQIGWKDNHLWACQFGDWYSNTQKNMITIRLSNLELNGSDSVNCIITTHITWPVAVKFAANHNCPDLNWSISFAQSDQALVNMTSVSAARSNFPKDMANFIHQTLREIIMSTGEFMTVSYQEYINIIWASGSQRVPEFNAYYLGDKQISCKRVRGLSRDNAVTAGLRRLVNY